MEKTMNYYQEALKYEGTPYKSGGMDKNGIDCSGLVNVATGHKSRVWHTSSKNPPPGNFSRISAPVSSVNDFFSVLKVGDLFVWKGHAAFYAGGEKLFHARKPGTVAGFTGDLKIYWIKEKGFPEVWRQI